MGSLAFSLLLTFGAGSAQAAVICSASSFSCPASGTCTIGGAPTIGNGCLLDFGSRAVQVTGAITAATIGGSFEIRAGSLKLANGKLRSVGDAVTPGGDIEVSVTGAFIMETSATEIRTDGNGGGGSIDITASSIEIRDGRLLADGGSGPDCGDGGSVSLTATSGPVLVSGVATTISAQTTNDECDGGSISVIGSAVTIEGGMNITGGSPGSIVVLADTGNITLSPTIAIKADGLGDDEGSGTDAGSIQLEADNGNITLSGSVSATGDGADGWGGDIFVLSGGTLQTADRIEAKGTGNFASGGGITLEGDDALTVGGNLTASGGTQSDGGLIDLSSSGPIQVVTGKAFSVRGGVDGGGNVSISTVSQLDMAGSIDATTSTSNSRGGSIDIEGCQVNIRGNLDTRALNGKSGDIDIVGGAITVFPLVQIQAAPCPAANCIGFELNGGLLNVSPTAILNPPAVMEQGSGAMPCCGNGVVNDGVHGQPNTGEQCDDGGYQSCDGCTPGCELEPSPPCPSDGNECTLDCDPGSGCTYKPQSFTPCSDEPGGGNICTADICAGGTCTHLPRICDDGIDCTTDGCSAGIGCTATPDDALCDDGESCTTDACNPASGDPVSGCKYTKRPDGISCDDDDVCTSLERCEDGVCTPKGPPLNCDDGDPCTFDRCMPQLGCSNPEDASACPCTAPGGAPLPAGTECADGHNCTVGDVCDGAGHCAKGPMCPDDGDPCTREACLLGGCLHFDDACPTSGNCVEGQPCSDGSTCTTGICHGGVCVSEAVSCSDGDRCTGEEACVDLLGCWQVSYTPIGDPLCGTEVHDAYACYRTRRSSGAAPFIPELGVSIEDQLWEISVDLRKQAALCLPTDVEGANPAAPAEEDVLEAYRIKAVSGTPKFVARTLQVTNQFGTTLLIAKRIDQAYVPSTMSESGTPPTPTAPNPDFFHCYRVSKAPGAPRFEPLTGISVEDAFGEMVVDLRKPVQLCNPANVNDLDPTAPGHEDHLLCYQAVPQPSLTRFGGKKNLNVTNTFGSEQVDATKLREVCVPSTVIELP